VPVTHEWVYILAVAIPSVCALAGVIWQARKTRSRGTEEHLMARSMLLEHGEKLDKIDGKVDRLDTKVDRLDQRTSVLEDGERQAAADIADIRSRQPLYGLGEGK